MKKRLAAGLGTMIFTFWMLVPLSAHALLITYTDRTTFNEEAGTTTLIDFEAQQTAPSGYATYYGATLTVGDVTFVEAGTADPGWGVERFFVFSSYSYSTSGTTNYLNNNHGGDQVGIDFSSDVYSVGTDIGWLTPWGGGGSTITISLSNGESFTTSIVGPLAGSNTALGFVGFSSDIAFSSITITDPSNSLMLDNFAYSSSPANAVPEPSTMLLLGSGLLGLVGLNRRRKA